MKRMIIIDFETGEFVPAIGDPPDRWFDDDKDVPPRQFVLSKNTDDNNFALELVRALRVEILAQGLDNAFTRGAIEQLEEQLNPAVDEDRASVELTRLREIVISLRMEALQVELDDMKPRNMREYAVRGGINLGALIFEMSREELLAEINETDPDGLPERIIIALNDNAGTGTISYLNSATGAELESVIGACAILVENKRIKWDSTECEYELISDNAWLPSIDSVEV